MKKESDYSKCVIYKIVSKDKEIQDLYIGHTCNFYGRKALHKHHSTRKNTKIYSFIKENGGFDKFEMIVLEEYPCKSRLEATTKERMYIELYKPSLNNNLPHQTYKELRNKNIEKYNLYMKDYMRKYYQKKKVVLDSIKSLLLKPKKDVEDTVYFD